MLNKSITALLAVLVMNLGIFAFSKTMTNENKDAKNIQKTKAVVTKLGTGIDAKIEVKLKDGTRVNGYVSEVNNDQFVVTDPNTGTKTPIPYPQVQKATGKHHRLVLLALIGGLVVAIAIGVAASK